MKLHLNSIYGGDFSGRSQIRRVSKTVHTVSVLFLKGKTSGKAMNPQ